MSVVVVGNCIAVASGLDCAGVARNCQPIDGNFFHWTSAAPCPALLYLAKKICYAERPQGNFQTVDVQRR